MAGFFGFFDYTKPGKGVEKEEFKPNFRTFFRILFGRLGKLVQLNLIYILLSLPIFLVALAFVPIGEGEVEVVGLFTLCISTLLYLSVIGLAPVATGFTYVLRNYTSDRHAWVLSDFFEHIKKNFKQAMLVLLIDVAAFLIIPFIFNFYTGIINSETASSVLKNLSFFARTVIVLFTAIYFIMHFYIYQIMIGFDMKLKQIFKNSLIFALAHLPRNVGVLALIATIAALTFGIYVEIGLILSLLIVPTLIGYTVNFIVQPVITRYMIAPKQEEQA